MENETVVEPQPDGELAADSLKKQRKGLPRGRPFQSGQSGNPSGRRPGSRNVVTMLAQAILEDDVEALMQKAVSRALQGDPWALGICIERVLAPQRQSPVSFDMPPLKTADDAVAALAAIAEAAASGELAPSEPRDLTETIDAFVHALEAGDFERRLNAIEAIDREFAQAARAAG